MHLQSTTAHIINTMGFGGGGCLFVLFIRDRVSLYSPGRPGTFLVDQAGLELRNPPTSAFQELELKACATTPSSCISFHELLISSLKDSYYLHEIGF